MIQPVAVGYLTLDAVHIVTLRACSETKKCRLRLAKI
jgi:hypothetical protein